VPARHRDARTYPVALVAGGTVGALVRYAVATTWPYPRQMWVSTTVIAAVAFLIAGFLVSIGLTSALRVGIVGMCAAAASLSAWAVLTISQPPKLSIAFLLGTPAAAAIGLFCGLLIARVVSR